MPHRQDRNNPTSWSLLTTLTGFPCLIGRIGISRCSFLLYRGRRGFHASQVGSEYYFKRIASALGSCFHASQVGSEYGEADMIFWVAFGTFPCLVGRIGIGDKGLRGLSGSGVSMPRRQDRNTEWKRMTKGMIEFPCLVGRIGILKLFNRIHILTQFPCLVGRIGIRNQV